MKLSKACSKYGASMGRSSHISEKHYPVKFHLRQVPLDSGGYDNGGAYWGIVTTLYRAWGDGAESVQEMFFRATTRAKAKCAVLGTFPNARFYR